MCKFVRIFVNSSCSCPILEPKRLHFSKVVKRLYDGWKSQSDGKAGSSCAGNGNNGG